MSSIQPAVTGPDRRLQATGLQLETAVGLVGCLIIFAGDTQSLALIPLLAQLEKQYSLSPSQASWALSALTLAAAAWVPTLTRLGDKLGMRRLVLVGLIVSVLGNLLSAVSTGFPMFVASRAVLGLSAAMPLVYAILRARSANERRINRGIGILTTATGAGIAVSFLLSGVIIQADGSIRTVFWVMTALSVVALAISWWILPDAPTRPAESIDWVGAVGISAGLVCIVLAITEGNTWHWSSPQVIGLLIGGVAIFALWTLYEYRAAAPMINIRRVFNGTSTPAFIAVGLLGALGIYSNFVVSAYVEMPSIVGYGLGGSVLVCAYVLCALSAASIACGLMSAPVIARFGPRAVMTVSGIVVAASFFFAAFNHAQYWQYVVTNVVFGAAWGFGYAAGYAAILKASGKGEGAMFTATNTVFGAAFASLGPGIFTAILTSKTIPHTPIPAESVFRTLWLFAAFVGVAIVVLGFLVRRPRSAPADQPDMASDTRMPVERPAQG